MSNPKLSVITIVYNNAADIERTMLSVLGQTYVNIEYIIVDGLSTDGTLDIVKKYKDKLAKLISEKDEWIYDAMNKGLTAATGDYVWGGGAGGGGGAAGAGAGGGAAGAGAGGDY